MCFDALRARLLCDANPTPNHSRLAVGEVNLGMNRAARRISWSLIAAIGWLAVVVSATTAQGQTRLADISRIKGQEDNDLVGLGLVVGLSGTGDGGDSLPTIRALASAMTILGHPLPGGLKELNRSKNIALVMVSAVVPPTGAREGGRIDCTVSSVGTAKSLAGGRLFATPLLDARPGSDIVYGLAQGTINAGREGARTGRIHLGCRLESDFFTPFVKDGKITVVLDQEVANFRLAHEVEYRINEEFRLDSYDNSRVPAKAIDQKNIEVFIPPQSINHPAEFVAQIEDLILDYVPRVARVYIDQESGLVVIGGDVEIRPVAFTHKDIVVETGNPSEDRFIGLDTFDRDTTKLRSLVEALNAIKVPSTDVIEIIRGLKRQGSLLGKVIVE